MTGQQAAERYTSGRRRVREWSAQHTPRVLTHYPFEVLAAVIAVLMGLPFLLGVAAPASLLALVGSVAFYAWAAALVIGGITVAVGLRVGDRPNPFVVASGLQLLGGCFGIYGLAAVVVLGWAGITAVAAYACLCLLALVRATHFRRVLDIQRGAARLPTRGGR